MKDVLNEIFGDKKFYKKLLVIALPIVLQNFIASSLNFVDTIMVGKLGEQEIAAVGIANQYFLLFNLLIFGLFSGCGIFISQFWGVRDIKNIRKVLGIGNIIGLALSAVFMIFALIMPYKIIAIFNGNDKTVIKMGGEYLRIVSISYIFTSITFCYGFASRCIEKTVLPMLTSAFALICNTVLNYIFIFGMFGMPALGIRGAALATLIARVLETILLVGYIYLGKGILAAKIKEMINFNIEFFRKVIKTITPVVLNEGCWALGSLVYTIAYGKIGTQAIASIQICSTVQNLFMIVTFGLANASAVMVAKKIGAGKEDEGKIYAKRFAVLSCLIGLILGVLLAAAAKPILMFFNVSDKVIYDSLMILYIAAGMMIIRTFNNVLIVGILRGGGDAKYALMAEAVTMWCVGVPLAFIGAVVIKVPVYVVAAMITLEEFLKFGACLVRLLSNRWIKNVICDI